MNTALPSSPHAALPAFYSDQIFPSRLTFLLSAMLLALLATGQAYAHRGPADEVDDCRIRVGYEVVHFTAYTPTLTGAKEYCKTIPQLGPTNLVFDYEGKKLRHVTVEFEITKEPEGSRIFYQEPRKIETGSVNGVVDFSQHGPGDYLAHVTIVDNGKKLDSHLPFQVGFEETSYGGIIKFGIAFILFTLAIVFMIYKAKKAPPKEEMIEQESSPSDQE